MMKFFILLAVATLVVQSALPQYGFPPNPIINKDESKYYSDYEDLNPVGSSLSNKPDFPSVAGEVVPPKTNEFPINQAGLSNLAVIPNTAIESTAAREPSPVVQETVFDAGAVSIPTSISSTSPSKVNQFSVNKAGSVAETIPAVALIPAIGLNPAIESSSAGELNPVVKDILKDGSLASPPVSISNIVPSETNLSQDPILIGNRSPDFIDLRPSGTNPEANVEIVSNGPNFNVPHPSPLDSIIDSTHSCESTPGDKDVVIVDDACPLPVENDEGILDATCIEEEKQRCRENYRACLRQVKDKCLQRKTPDWSDSPRYTDCLILGAKSCGYMRRSCERRAKKRCW